VDIGMLWFDNDKQIDLDQKVLRAVVYYHKKYGRKPNLCFVHPCMKKTKNTRTILKTKEVKGPTNSEVEIKESVEILPNHFWIGVTQKEV